MFFVKVFDLQYASPATVSRCGMVYVDPKNLRYTPFWEKWVNSRSSKAERDDLPRLYEKYVPTLIDMVIEGIIDGRQGEKMKTIIPLTDLNMVSILQLIFRNVYLFRNAFKHCCMSCVGGLCHFCDCVLLWLDRCTSFFTSHLWRWQQSQIWMLSRSVMLAYRRNRCWNVTG